MGQFNAKQFLLKPVNDGLEYDPDAISCGCVKYNFDKVCNLNTDYSGYTNPKIQNMMDIAETLLANGYPERAKLFVVDMVEKHFKGIEISNGITNWENSFWHAPPKPYTTGRSTPIVDKVKTRIKEAVK